MRGIPNYNLDELLVLPLTQEALASPLGIRVECNDPPRARQAFYTLRAKQRKLSDYSLNQLYVHLSDRYFYLIPLSVKPIGAPLAAETPGVF